MTLSVFMRMTFFTGLFTFSFATQAQTLVKLTGAVTDSSNNKIAAGNVFLLRQADTTLCRVTILEGGRFIFDAIEKGRYLIKIISSGFNESIIELHAEVDTQVSVQLGYAIHVLENVTVSNVQKVFSVSNGNIKVNIDNPVFAAIPDPISLLSKLPGVQLSPDGETISVVGKGKALIYLDNQQISVNELKSLSSRDVKSVEILSNPPARFEASGRVVIFITRKFSRREGFKAELSETFSQKRFRHNWSSVNLSYKLKRTEITAGLQYNYLNLWESNSNQFSAGTDVSSDYSLKATGPRKQLLVRAGVYFRLNEQNSLSLSANTRIHKEPFDINTNSGFREGLANSTSYTRTDNYSEKPYSGIILNYFRKFKKSNGDLFVGGQYSSYTQRLTSAIFNSINNGSLQNSQYRDQAFYIQAASGRADYNKKLSENTTLGVGLVYSSAWSDALLQNNFFNPSGGSNTDYAYTEDITAAYSQLTTKLGKVSANLGLRFENSVTIGKSSTTPALTVDRTFNRLFPRCSFSFPIDSIRMLTIAYTSSVSRPNYSNLSQIVTYINPFFEWSSNANLKPSVTDEISATLQSGQYSFQLTLLKRKNPIYYNSSYDISGRKFTVIDDNFDEETGVNFSATIPVNYKKWSSTNMATVSLNKVEDADAVNLKTTPYLYFYSGNQFSLNSGYSLFSNFWILTSRYEGIFKRNTIFALDFGASKAFKNGLNLSLSCNDIFRSINFREKIFINNVSSDIIYYDDGREVSLNLRYSFGSIKNAAYRNKNVNDNSDRIR